MENLRQRLLEAGVEELQTYGIDRFSLRRVAEKCGVSCAAPYKHFESKQDFLCAIAEVLNQKWFKRQQKALEGMPDDAALRLRMVCKEYLRFLRDDPNFCALITSRDDRTGKWHLVNLFNDSSVTKQLIRRYVEDKKLSPEETYNLTYAMRSLLYGTAMMHRLDDSRMTDGVLAILDHAIDASIIVTADE